MASTKSPDLDDLDYLKDIDISNMLGTLEHLPKHIEEARKIPPADLGDFKPNLIVVLGMGGSAIAGDIVDSWLNKIIQLPIVVVRGYELPKLIDSNTLVFAVSFSGNTEETLAAFEEALKCEAKVIAISTGGKLEERSKELNVPHILLQPTEQLVPRAAIAYLLLPIITNLTRLGLIPKDECDLEVDDAITTLKTLSNTLGAASKSEDNQSKQIAIKLSGRLPLIYSYKPFSSISYRWQTQLNENSKVLARCAELPEINHNDIVGWMGDEDMDKYSVVLLRDLAIESR
ncbi:MAG: bifunctional phosphoglucose/phosphomannose isomerase, partial [Thermoplasmata archaeon]